LLLFGSTKGPSGQVLSDQNEVKDLIHNHKPITIQEQEIKEQQRGKNSNQSQEEIPSA
jgi:hypothetical protein